MQKFEEAKLDIVRFDAADVIATSNDTPEVAITGLIYEEEQRNLERSIEAQ